MDVEARKKYCGLLMFDIPTIAMKSPTSRNNDIIINNMSTQEVDPSSLNNNLPYESSHLDHQFIIQENFSGDFANTTRALAAGAAATSDDLVNQGNLDPSNAIDGESPNSRSQPPKRTPRPPNAFILYRRAKQPGIIASQRNLTNAEVSRTISDMWRKEPEEIRLEWERYADRKKLEHMQTYPNYVYRPNKNKSKVDKRRQSRRQTTNSSNGPSNGSAENKTTNSGATPVRRKSSKNANRPLSKLDLPSSMNNGMAGFNMQQSIMNQSANSTSHSDTMTSNTSYILPSPEIPLLSSHFTDNPEEFVSTQSQLTPITPLTPHTPLTPISTPEQMQMREHDFKIRQQYHNSLFRFVPEEELNAYQQQHQQQHHHQQQQQQHHHHQGNAPQFSFQPINGLTSYHQTVDPLEFFVPDVAQQQQQMMAEMLLHHEHHHITPTTTVTTVPTVPSSNSTSAAHPVSTIPVQYYSNGSNTTSAAIAGNHPSFTEMLGFEFPNLLSGSVNHNHVPDQYLQ
jgi:hypothetical protein